MNCKRGEIYYVSKYPTTGSEQQGGRPAIIVSNEQCNLFSDTVEIVFLTTKQKNPIPTHVSVFSAPMVSTALCEQVTTVSKTRIGDFCGKCTVEEMERVDAALRISLGILPGYGTAKEASDSSCKVDCDLCGNNSSFDLSVLQGKYETLMELYDKLLSRISAHR